METDRYYFSSALQEMFRFFLLSKEEREEFEKKDGALNLVVQNLMCITQPTKEMLKVFDDALDHRREFIRKLAEKHGFPADEVITITEGKCFLRTEKFRMPKECEV